MKVLRPLTTFLISALLITHLSPSFARAEIPEIKNYEELAREVKLRQGEAADTGQPIEADRQETILKAWETGRMIEAYAAANLGDLNYKEWLIKRLSADSGIESDQLTVRMKFAREYPALPAGDFLSWSHYKRLLNLEDAEERVRLAEEAELKRWGVRELGEKTAEHNRLKAGAENIPAVGSERPYIYQLIVFRNQPALDLGFANYFSPEGIEAFQKGDWIIWENGKPRVSDLKGAPVYYAEINEVNDGDTVHAVIDLGFNLRTEQRLRLEGIDAPELGVPGGTEAREFLKDRVLKSGGRVLLKIGKQDKFNRYLAYVWVDGKSVNQELIDSGHAVPMKRNKSVNPGENGGAPN